MQHGCGAVRRTILSNNDTRGELERLDDALETIDVAKRESMRKLVVGTMFIAPIVASFAIDGLTVGPAMAIPFSPNSSVIS